MKIIIAHRNPNVANLLALQIKYACKNKSLDVHATPNPIPKEIPPKDGPYILITSDMFDFFTGAQLLKECKEENPAMRSILWTGNSDADTTPFDKHVISTGTHMINENMDEIISLTKTLWEELESNS